MRTLDQIQEVIVPSVHLGVEVLFRIATAFSTSCQAKSEEITH
jgi:hypothetical protein